VREKRVDLLAGEHVIKNQEPVPLVDGNLFRGKS
jgi:hypothetical protein